MRVLIVLLMIAASSYDAAAQRTRIRLSCLAADGQYYPVMESGNIEVCERHRIQEEAKRNTKCGCGPVPRR